jgi:hypothetical protein
MRHYQYPLDNFGDDFFMSDNEAMSTRSHSTVTPSPQNEAGLNGGVQPMEDFSTEPDKGQILEIYSDNISPFPPHDTYMLDEAMPP